MPRQDISVKIVEAHNVYFMCNNVDKEFGHGSHFPMNNSFESEPEKRKADMASTSVQTDPQQSRSSPETPVNDVHTSSENDRSSTIHAEPQGAAAENEPSGRKIPITSTNQLTEQLQTLQLSEDHTVEINQRDSLDPSAQHSENASACSEETQTYVSSSDLFIKIINKKYPKDGNDLIKVFVTHSEADTKFAEEVVGRLRRNNRFWVAANYELEPVMRMNNADFRMAAISWADILVPLVTDTWLKEIDNVSCENRSASSLNAKYTFQLIQSDYISRACTNFKIISAVKEGTNVTFRGRPEIRDAITLMADYPRFERIIINFHRLVEARKQNCKS